MRKLTALWVPKSLSNEQMADRSSVRSALLKSVRSKDDFVLRLVTVDGTRVHNLSVSRAWIPKTKEVQDTTICWQDVHSMLGRKMYYIESFTKKSAITGMHDANTKAYTCNVAIDAAERNGYELTPHTAYSSDLAPCHVFLFLKLKNYIRWRHFRSNEEGETVEEWANGKNSEFYNFGLSASH